MVDTVNFSVNCWHDRGFWHTELVHDSNFVKYLTLVALGCQNYVQSVILTKLNPVRTVPPLQAVTELLVAKDKQLKETLKLAAEQGEVEKEIDTVGCSPAVFVFVFMCSPAVFVFVFLCSPAVFVFVFLFSPAVFLLVFVTTHLVDLPPLCDSLEQLAISHPDEASSLSEVWNSSVV